MYYQSIIAEWLQNNQYMIFERAIHFRADVFDEKSILDLLWPTSYNIRTNNFHFVRLSLVIIKNAIRCNRCGDESESTRFNICDPDCGACSVDGGHEYLRRCAPSENDFTDISIVETEKDAGDASSK